MDIVIVLALLVIAGGLLFGKPLQITITHKMVYDAPPPDSIDQVELSKEQELQASLTEALQTINNVMMGGDQDGT